MFDMPSFEINPTVQPTDNGPVGDAEPGKIRITLDDMEQEFSPDTETGIIASELVAVEAKRDALIAEIEAERKRIAEIEAAQRKLREEFDERMSMLANEKNELKGLIFDREKEIRRLNEIVWSLQRQLREAIRKVAITQEFRKNAIAFDQRTASLFWREFALPHQIEGAKMLANSGRAILGDKMGLGKTLTSLITADMLGAQKILIVVPADVLRNFEREISHWAPHRDVTSLGKVSKSQRNFTLSILKRLQQYVVTINYEAWRKDKDLLNSLKDLHFDMVICDEAHTMKETSTSAFRGVKELVYAENECPVDRGHVSRVEYQRGSHRLECTTCDWNSQDAHTTNRENGLYRKEDNPDLWVQTYANCSVKYVIPMTGTVILNKPQDLFPLLYLIDREAFATERDFLDDYCQQDYYTQKWVFRSGGLERLVKILGARYVARDRNTAGVKLPKQEIQVHEIDFDKERYADQWRIMEQIGKHAQIVLGDKKANILATIAMITRKRQANVWPAGITIRDPETKEVLFRVGDEVRESIKLDKVVDLVEEFTAEGNRELGERVVVFSQFKEPLRELENRLLSLGISTARFDGDTAESVRDSIKIDFDRKYADQPGYQYRYQVVLCNYKTGGVGLNFTSATQVIILDEEWNPGKNEQAYARVDRVGQTEESTVHVLRIPNTIDTWMASLNQQKANIISGFEGATENVTAQLLEAMERGEIV